MTSTEAPLHLMIYDNTCGGYGGLPGLSHSWWAGGHLFQLFSRFDAFKGVRTWEEALEWLGTYEPTRQIAEVQFWGHGNWGNAYIDRVPLDQSSLQKGHPYYEGLCRLQERFVGPRALWWFRTCETFGAIPGQQFAKAFGQFLNCRVAGHTYIIGPWHSGLHCLAPGQEPSWDPAEGLKEGTPEAPRRALWSHPFRPRTLHFLHSHIPSKWDA